MPVGQLAPAGTAVRPSEIVSWLAGAPDSVQAAERLRQALCDRYGVPYAFLVSSGRAAMFLVLRMLSRLAGPQKNEVIVPAYTCYSVAAAAVRAGLRVRVCDIDPETLSYDLPALAVQDFSKVVAIITANLYGIPNDLPAIEAIAKRNNVYLLDDAAQSLNARIGGRAVGTFGDVGLFSFDKGKNITSVQGGVVVTRSDALGSELQRVVAELPTPPVSRTLLQTAQQLAYTLLLRPWLYWMPANLPALKLGDTVYTTEYPVERYSAFLAPLVAAQLRRIDTISAERVRVAYAIQSAIEAVPELRAVRLLSATQPVFPRLPMLASDAGRRERVLRALQRNRLGATRSYPLSIADIPDLQPHLAPGLLPAPGGQRVASTILTLPTHHYVTPRHIEHMAAATCEALAPP